MAKVALTTHNLLRKYALLVFIFSFLIYANSIRNGYNLDDKNVTVTNPQRPDNPRVAKGIAGIPEIFTSRYVVTDSHSFDYRPVAVSTFAIEYEFFGSNPHVSHFFNVLIYAFTCAFLFFMLSKLLSAYSVVLPLLITLLFTVHPVHTEVVNNIKCRDELLSFLFGLVSLYFFLQVAAPGEKKWRPVLKFIFFLVLALLCKKTAVLFIGLMLLVAWFFTDIPLKKAARYVLLLVGAYLLFVVFKKAMLPPGPEIRAYTFYENPLYFEHGVLNRIHAALFTTGYYLRLLLVPYPLCFYYGYDAVSREGWGEVLAWSSLVAHGLLVFYALRKIKQKDVLSFGILVYLLGLAPFANLLTPAMGILGERFIYFSSLGFCIAAACLLIKLAGGDLLSLRGGLKNMDPVLKRTSVVLLLLFSVMVFARNTKWKDLLTLSENDVKHFENSYMIQAFVANNLYAQMINMPPGAKQEAAGRARSHIGKAAEILRKGLEQHGEDHVSMSTLGVLYSDLLDQPDEAIVLFKKVLQKVPAYEAARINLVHCYELKNMTDTAIVLYEELAAGGTKNPKVYLRLHDLYVKKGDYQKALASDKKGQEKFPQDIQVTLNLGNAHMLLADTLMGLAYFEKAAALAPADPDLQMRVAAVFHSAGKMQKANEYQMKAKQVRGSADARR